MTSFKKIIRNILIILSMAVMVGLQVDTSQAETTSSTSFFSASNAPQYVSVVYTWGSMIVGGLSLVVITIAGINYMRSMGNQDVITQSKNLISGALIGLFLVVGGYFLLKLMDPRFVELKLTTEDLTLSADQGAETCASWLGKSCEKNLEEKECKDADYWECVPSLSSGNTLGRDILHMTYSKVQCINKTWQFGHDKLLKVEYDNRNNCGCDKKTPLTVNLFDQKWCASGKVTAMTTLEKQTLSGLDACKHTTTECFPYTGN